MESAYDVVEYPGYAYPQTHPGRLATMATLKGLSPAPVASARVLELGCGDGGNLLPMAAALPAAEFVGIDAAARPVAAGNAFAAAAGLRNVELLELDLERLPPGLGQFDYAIAHGVYSWVPPAARTALLAALDRHLTPAGVAYVSYNAYPGSHLRDMANEVLAFHLQGVTDPAERIRGAQSLMRMIVAARDESPYGRVLREHMERLLEHDEWLLFHDELAEVNTPVYFHEFVAHARAHRLRFLAEAEPGDGAEPASWNEALGGGAETREQYRDFITNRMFRQTLLCRADADVRHELDPARLTPLLVGSPGGSVKSSHEFVAPLIEELGRRWPGRLSFGELMELAADATEPQLQEMLLSGFHNGAIELSTEAPAVVAAPGPLPRASAYARLQAERGADTVTTLLHTNIALTDALGRRLLALADGTRDRDALATAMRAAMEPGPPAASDVRASVDAGLAELARLGLLEA